ncbi:MAG: ATPase [Kosmotoga sp.]|nr:MAG: ATPase [Kosmotoga sp.]
MIINKQGEILSFLAKGNTDYLQSSIYNFKETLTEGIYQVSKKIDIKITDIDYSFLGLPSYGEQKKYEPQIEEIISEILGPGKYSLGNDVEAGWAGSLGCKPGIHLVAGTGSIGFGIDPVGNKARAGGWGNLFGDEGSAYWLGREALSIFSKQADGRLEKTDVYRIIKNKTGLEEDIDLISYVIEKLKMKRNKIAQFAMELHKAAREGDTHALNAFSDAACELNMIIEAIIEKLDFPPGLNISVSYSGGVFKAGNYILKPLKRIINERAVLVKPLLKPVTGAALYALSLYTDETDFNSVIEKLKDEENLLKSNDQEL